MIEYWKHPCDRNRPITYAHAPRKTEYVVRLMNRFAYHNSRILELGCNCGRNLIGLEEMGFGYAEGVEINEEACEMVPDYITIYNMSIEDFFKHKRQYDIVFTMAVLMHLPPASEFVFAKIQESCRVLIVIEDEGHNSKRQWARDYSKIFKQQVFAEQFMPPLVTRVFKCVPLELP